MGKDKEARFTPRKGRPTAEGGKKGMVTIDHKHQQAQIELEEKLGLDPDQEIPPGPEVRHPNRNVEKGYDHSASVAKKSAKHTKRQFTEELSRSTSARIGADGFTLADFESLASFHADICISVYLPINAQSSEGGSRVDAMILKNTLQYITSQLQDRGLHQTFITKLMEPAYDFLKQEAFNTGQAGYGFFISEGTFKWIALPYVPKEYQLINSSFYVSPLVQLLSPKESFYVLVISKKQAKLFQGDQFSMHYIDIPELPNGVVDVVHVENKDDDEQFRGGTGDGYSHHDVVSGSPGEKDNIAMYLREVDNTLWKTKLAREHAPVVLVGVDYLISLYRNISQYKNICKDTISGNHDHDDMRVLYREARKYLQPHFERITVQALNDFGNQAAAGNTSIAISEIVSAAWFARVSQLFVAVDEEIWGTFDPETNQTYVHETRESNDDNLIDISIARTLLNGGTVHFVEKEKMPEQSKIAAIMRF